MRLSVANPAKLVMALSACLASWAGIIWVAVLKQRPPDAEKTQTHILCN